MNAALLRDEKAASWSGVWMNRIFFLSKFVSGLEITPKFITNFLHYPVNHRKLLNSLTEDGVGQSTTT
jgi:hypothetical protein